MMNDKDNNNMEETRGIITYTPSHVSLVSLSRLFGLDLAFHPWLEPGGSTGHFYPQRCCWMEWS
jgi:hypothetical protein